jgi:hypothetical protein
MKISKPALLVFCTTAEAATTGVLHSKPYVQRYEQRNSSLSVILGSNDTIILQGNATNPSVVVLDYKANVEGLPTFEVVSATGDTSRLEITYSETKTVLENFYMVSILAHKVKVDVNEYNRVTDPSLWPRPWIPTESISTT